MSEADHLNEVDPTLKQNAAESVRDKITAMENQMREIKSEEPAPDAESENQAEALQLESQKTLAQEVE